jgi:hypothetical protein
MPCAQQNLVTRVLMAQDLLQDRYSTLLRYRLVSAARYQAVCSRLLTSAQQRKTVSSPVRSRMAVQASSPPVVSEAAAHIGRASDSSTRMLAATAVVWVSDPATCNLQSWPTDALYAATGAKATALYHMKDDALGVIGCK